MSDNPLDHLISALSGLPGMGPRSAKRVALHLLVNKEKAMAPLIRILEEAAEKILPCPLCGNLDSQEPCTICRDSKRDASRFCVISSVAELWAIERTNSYNGLYHVLGGLLSALDGIGPGQLKIQSLMQRLEACHAEEVVLALSATVDGQTTAHYIADSLEKLPEENRPIKVTRLAHGVPVGGQLDFLDDGTITAALRSRSELL